MKRRVTCPERGTYAEVELTEDPVDGRILGVLSCSLLGCGVVDCEELCAYRLQQRRDARYARGSIDGDAEPVSPDRPRAARRGRR